MSGYIGPIPVPQGIQNKETFTATAGQTTFNTNGYTDGAFISVYLNGVRLVNGTDYTSTNGSDVVLASGANAGDVLDFETFNSFSLASQQFENITTKNPTHEDTDGGRESAISFKGEQSGGEISTLAQIQASHDGTADDQKGDLIFKTNDGSDNDAPTERMRIDSTGATTITTEGNEDTLVLKSNDADANAGPKLQFNRNSSSPADSDFAGVITFRGRNDAAQAVDYANINVQYGDVSDGTEDGTLSVQTIVGGTVRDRVNFRSSGVVFNDEGLDIDFRVESDSNTHAFFVEGNDGGGTPSIGFGISDPTKLATSGTAALGGGSGAILHLAGDDSQIRMANHVIHSDNGGNTIFHIRNNYGLTNSGAELSLESGHITFQSGTSFDERMRVAHDGDLLFEHTDATTGWGVNNRAAIRHGANYKFWSSRNSTTSRGHMIFYNPNGAVGSITTDGTATLFNTSSDYRLKENVADISDGITRVKQLAPKRFNFIADANKTVDGFLAHEAQTVVPEAITGTHNETEAIGNITDGDGNTVKTDITEPETLEEGQTWTATGTQPVYQGIDQAKFVPLLTAALKEAITKIETLETEMTSVKSRLDALEA